MFYEFCFKPSDPNLFPIIHNLKAKSGRLSIPQKVLNFSFSRVTQKKIYPPPLIKAMVRGLSLNEPIAIEGKLGEVHFIVREYAEISAILGNKCWHLKFQEFVNTDRGLVDSLTVILHNGEELNLFFCSEV